jgi:hypothetical protein
MDVLVIGEVELLLGKEYPLKWELQNEVLF